MSLDIIHARHAALLGTLEIPFKQDGWTTQLITPGAQAPVHVLICKPANGAVPSVYLSYIPLDDDSNELELMQMTCDLPDTISAVRLPEVMVLLHNLNTTMPIGAFCLSAMNTTYVRHVYSHEINGLPHKHDVVKMAEMVSGTAGVFQPMIQAVIQGQAATDVLQQIGQTGFTASQAVDDKSLFAQVSSYLNRKNMKFETAMDSAAIVLIRGKNAQFNLVIHARQDEQQVVVYSVGPIITPEDRRGEMALFITLANYGIFIGNFELDMNDGEVRYKTSQDVYSQTISDDMLARLIQASASTFDQYAPGIKAVAEGAASARQAIEQIEG